MNKLVPFTKFSKRAKKILIANESFVVADAKGTPVGFVFGRNSFISFLEHIDEEFERKVKDLRQAYDNPAGKLIDLIEEKLPINPEFVKDLKIVTKKTKKSDWIPIDEVMENLHA